MEIELLLAHADDHAPVLAEGLPLGAAADTARPPEAPLPKELRHDSRDPDVLSVQRWGVIAPEGPQGDRLLALIAPLIRARREAQQGAEVRVYRVPPGQDPEGAERWRKQVYWDERVAEEDLPRYLVILGDADLVSWDLQQRLASDVFVGRLAFADDRGYEAYADKVLRWEKQGRAPAARALFYSAHDGTAATSVGRRALMAPSAIRARERQAKGTFPASEIVEFGDPDASGADELLAEASRSSPGLLFSVSHGLGPPRRGWRSAAEQRALQGAMSLGRGEQLTADDLRSRPFLPGGVWFYLACFGAGTPHRSAYHEWLVQLQAAGKFDRQASSVLSGLPRDGDRPFVAALPQAVLENPDGPLAVMSHVDLAWTYSFQDLGATAQARPSRFHGVFRSLVEGHRVGSAHHQLARFFSEVSIELTTVYEADAVLGGARPVAAERLAERAHLWMLRHDLAGYVLLGDPAARLPIAPGVAEEAPSVGEIESLGAFAGPGARSDALDVGRMEEAVLAVLARREPVAEIAARARISPDELADWARQYREAGLATLEQLRRRKP